MISICPLRPGKPIACLGLTDGQRANGGDAGADEVAFDEVARAYRVLHDQSLLSYEIFEDFSNLIKYIVKRNGMSRQNRKYS